MNFTNIRKSIKIYKQQLAFTNQTKKIEVDPLELERLLMDRDHLADMKEELERDIDSLRAHIQVQG